MYEIATISQQFDWIKSVYAGEPGFFRYNRGKDIALDTIGDVYTAGYFYRGTEIPYLIFHIYFPK